MTNTTPESVDDTLLPCPFCGPRMVAPDICNTPDGSSRWQVFCGGCGGAAGNCSSREGAITAWNTRASAQQPEDGLVEAIIDACRFVDRAVCEGIDLGDLESITIYEALIDFEDAEYIEWSEDKLAAYVRQALRTNDHPAPEQAKHDGLVGQAISDVEKLITDFHPQLAEYLDWDGHRIALDRILTALSRTEDGWRSIESAPRDGTQILIASRHGTEIAWWEDTEPVFKWRFYDSTDLTPSGCCDMEDEDRVPVNGAHADYATHWRPLPEPPKQEAQ